MGQGLHCRHGAEIVLFVRYAGSRAMPKLEPNLHRQLPFKNFSQWLPHLVETLTPVPLSALKNLQRRVD